MPEVSVIIPTYNSANYVIDAVDSVLNQSFDDLEVLVIDDGSTDETESLLSRYSEPVRYIRQQNGGVAVARNRGISESRGRYVAFLDADDTWLPDKLAVQIGALRAHTGHRFCYTAFTLVASDLSPLGIVGSKRQGRALEDLLLRGNVVGSICTVLCERSLFEKAGVFDPALSQCADWDMWVRLAAMTEFLYLDRPTVTYRQHGSNMSRNAPLLERDSVRVLEKGFAMPEVSSSLRANRRSALARNYMVLAGTYFHARFYGDFLRCAARSVSMDFRQLGYLVGFPLRRISALASDT
ncbi:MAG TPA: glycosyltransferase [Blastocatellia bacterium]|nr:glycosyltransferase [Blastocatellia bacterium]